MFSFLTGWLLFGLIGLLRVVSADVNPLSDQTLPFLKAVDAFYRYLESANGTDCAGSARKFKQAVSDGESWALDMTDASGRPESGIQDGALTFPGLFSECVQVFTSNWSDNGGFGGQYCMAQFTLWGDEPPVKIRDYLWHVIANASIRVGLCFPSTCNEQEAQTALSLALDEVFDGANQKNLKVINCQTRRNSFNPNPGTIVVMVILSFLLLMSILGTTFDLTRTFFNNKNKGFFGQVKGQQYGSALEVTNNPSTEVLCQMEVKEKKSKWSQVLLAFSIPKNSAFILSTGCGEGAILVFHGIRFLSMVWIIVLHSYSFAMESLAFQNPSDAATSPSHFLSQIYANGSFSVDSFFYLSGFLQSYLSAKQWTEKGKMTKPHVAILHRYIRLTPLMMVLIAFCATLLPWLGDGPFWFSSIKMLSATCQDNWWVNAVYLQNFINTANMCFGHTWYSAVDFQFFAVSLCLLPLLSRRQLWGFVALFTLVVLSIGITAYLTVAYHYPGVPYVGQNAFSQDALNGYSAFIYIKPYCRIAPYLVGVAMGHLLYSTRSSFVLEKRYIVLGWTVTALAIPALIFCTWPVYKGETFSEVGEIVYGSFSRTAWALALSWMTYACVAGHGGFISTFLSWKAFVPLSKLTFSAYMVHPILMSVFYGTRQVSYDYSAYFLLYLIMGNLMLSYAAAFVLSVFIETPFVLMEKIFLKLR